MPGHMPTTALIYVLFISQNKKKCRHLAVSAKYSLENWKVRFDI